MEGYPSVWYFVTVDWLKNDLLISLYPKMNLYIALWNLPWHKKYTLSTRQYVYVLVQSSVREEKSSFMFLFYLACILYFIYTAYSFFSANIQQYPYLVFSFSILCILCCNNKGSDVYTWIMNTYIICDWKYYFKVNFKMVQVFKYIFTILNFIFEFFL